MGILNAIMGHKYAYIWLICNKSEFDYIICSVNEYMIYCIAEL